ncbi:MAG: hypothetical protein U9P00_14760 [Pseudomonadota bacterium]|nr:hypothetical protein [Pseudomonadota bacterium]
MNDLSHVGMMNCWICGEGSTIILKTDLRPTLPMNMGALPSEVCSKCKSLAEDNDGIWMISIRDGEEPPRDNDESWNPYRTGGLALLKKEALKEVLQNTLKEPEETIKMVDRHFYFYLYDSIWDQFGLPERGVEINNLEEKTD